LAKAVRGAARFAGDEAEVRKAELRKKLADLGGPLTEGRTVIPTTSEPGPGDKTSAA